ncbi:hypothetical protein NDU88_000148, partial [Pleurodeles waltl]
DHTLQRCSPAATQSSVIWHSPLLRTVHCGVLRPPDLSCLWRNGRRITNQTGGTCQSHIPE